MPINPHFLRGRFLGVVLRAVPEKSIVLAAMLLSGLTAFSASSDATKEGREIYLKNCFTCHQLNGQGVIRMYPPLAGSDFLMGEPRRVIRVLCEGLNAEILVNWQKYNRQMPPVVLTDEQVATVLNYVRNSWGNQADSISAELVGQVRATTVFPTFDKLQEANSYAPLPPAPEGFTIREVVRLPYQVVRMANDPTQQYLYLLHDSLGGNVSKLDPQTGQLTEVIAGTNYLLHREGDFPNPIFILAMAVDARHRLYLACNQQNSNSFPVQNYVTIYRTPPIASGADPGTPKPWFQTNYPGNAAYIHAVENMSFGPDGFLYVGNGARTDANQAGDDPRFYQGGETPITSSMWRIDPESDHPTLEVYARGIRNAFGFCWNDKGEMIATENGPDADAPEELNFIQKGRHYGFPYRFSNWTKKAYAHTPDAPSGLEFTLPIPNLGPDGGFHGEPLYTFDPHSSPGGIIFLGDEFPAGWKGTYLLTRFGNFLGDGSVGFDVLQAILEKDASGNYESHIKTVLAPLGRPIDIHLMPHGKIYVCEYSRGIKNGISYALPGRIIELALKSAAN